MNEFPAMVSRHWYVLFGYGNDLVLKSLSPRERVNWHEHFTDGYLVFAELDADRHQFSVDCILITSNGQDHEEAFNERSVMRTVALLSRGSLFHQFRSIPAASSVIPKSTFERWVCALIRSRAALIFCSSETVGIGGAVAVTRVNRDRSPPDAPREPIHIESYPSGAAPPIMARAAFVSSIGYPALRALQCTLRMVAE